MRTTFPCRRFRFLPAARPSTRRGCPWCTAPSATPGPKAMTAAGGSPPPWPALASARRHGGDHGAQHPADVRGPFRRAHGRRRPERAQHPPGRRQRRLHPGARRSQGAAGRPRVRRHGRGRPGPHAGAARPVVVDIDDPAGPARRAGRQPGVRGVPRRRRSRLRVAAAGRRMGRDRAELHVRHHRQPEGRRLPPPRRLPERGRQRHDVGAAGHPVYLWTLPMFHCNGWCFPWTITALAGTHVCLRRVEAAGDRRGDRAPRRDAPVRRPDRREHARPRAVPAPTAAGWSASPPPARRRRPR